MNGGIGSGGSVEAVEALEASMKATCQLIVHLPFCSGQRLLNDIATSKSLRESIIFILSRWPLV